MSAQSGYKEHFRKLRAAYIERLKNSALLLGNCAKAASFERQEISRLQNEAHSLAGSGAIFGFPDLGAAAKKLDLFIDSALKSSGADRLIANSAAEELKTLAASLQEYCNNAAQSPDDPSPPATEESAFPRKFGKTFHVLLVDDDKTLTELLSISLLQCGLRVTVLNDGATAAETISRQHPDLVILDIMLPGVSGHEILHTLKKDPRTGKIPVLMLTAKTREEDVLGALHAGAIGYIIKPINPDKLVEKAAAYINMLRPQVLIADNDPLILKFLERKYAESGFRPILAQDGKIALDLAIDTKPDLIVLDQTMPGLSGLEVFEKLKETESTRDIPVIMLSARNQKPEIEKALAAGIRDYMTKPFDPDTLMKRSIGLLKSFTFE